MRLTHFPRSALCVAGFCASDSLPEVRPLRHTVACTWSQFPRPASASRGYVNLFHLTACTLCRGGYLFFFWLCWKGCMHCPSLYASPLSAPQSRPLHRLCLSAGYLGPPSVPCSTLARFVCGVTLSYLGLPSVLQGLCALAGFVCRTSLGSSHRLAK